ncbi:MAG TPA: hypothetical protein VNA21_15890, partial [Steroidobacteraceae bacterium]|nr:hypothetical protein [Steroidobacteraceae bacterium]
MHKSLGRRLVETCTAVSVHVMWFSALAHVIAGLTSCALRTAPPTAVDISIAAFNDFHGHLSPPASPTLIESQG